MLFATADVAITGRAGYDLWLLGGFSLFMAAALGFVAGYLSARMRDRASHHKARSCLIRLFDAASRSIESAQELCGLLEKASEPVFHPEEAEQLARRGQGLFESISRILTRHRPSVPADHASEAQVSTKSSDLRSTILTKLQWKVDQVHPVSGLPDLETFKANLDMLVERGAQTQRASGLLVVQIDRLSNLRTRFGTAGADTLLRKMAFISCRSVRDEDLVCQTSVDQIAVLIPEVDAEAGAKLARTVRDAIRQHHFRIEEQGMEILVTASLGYAACQPEDHADTLMDRAIDALRLSQRLGRNQLHVHNGDAVLHCAAAV
jgi:diguanylate cyclase (GGDEF)-like protein